jgi:hypothetical protein
MIDRRSRLIYLATIAAVAIVLISKTGLANRMQTASSGRDYQARASRRNIMHRGFVRARNSGKRMFVARGRLMSRNKKYTTKRARVISFKSRRRDGAGGGNRTHGLGIMRPSLYH